MGKYLASRIIEGALLYADVMETKWGKKYKAVIDATIDERGYMIDESGACVKKPEETADESSTSDGTDSGTDTTENTGK